MKNPLLALPSLVLLAAQADAQSTYSKEISRLMQDKCQNCHRPGDIAPFPLTTYEETKGRLAAIRTAVRQGKMPPWKPVAGPHAFRDNFGLSDVERTQLLEWIAAGAPEGDPADLPAPRSEAGEWQLGEPDLVLEMPKEFEIPGTGDTYRCFVLPYELTKRQWLSAVQVTPGNRAVAHHALLFLDPEGASTAWDGKDGKPGYDCFGTPGEGVEDVIGAWVPGARVTRLPDTIGVPLPGRGRVVLQLHYHSHNDHGVHLSHLSHKAVTDRTKVGFYFTKLPPRQEMIYGAFESDEIEIPAGAEAHRVTLEAELSAEIGLDLLAVAPHMHLLGREISLEKVTPAAERQSLIAIKDWDFDYQGFYTFAQSVKIEPGDQLRLTCTYNNTAENPRNPNDPPKLVRYGEGTEDEMCLVFLGVVLPEGFSVGQSQEQAARRFLRRSAGRGRP